jgi:hypothetical protein
MNIAFLETNNRLSHNTNWQKCAKSLDAINKTNQPNRRNNFHIATEIMHM